MTKASPLFLHHSNQFPHNVVGQIEPVCIIG